MKVVLDIECNRLVNPDQIWVIVCKDLDTGERFIFRKVTQHEHERNRFKEFWNGITLSVGHNILGYDLPILKRLVDVDFDPCSCVDTLIISKMADYPRKSHSLEDYGVEFGLEKIKFTEWSRYSQEMEDYCIRDVDINEMIYSKYKKFINNPKHQASIKLEHEFQLVVNRLHDNGFGFATEKAERLLEKVQSQLSELDAEITLAFPAKLKPIREITPKETKHGTLSLTDFRWLGGSGLDLTDFNGGPFTRCEWVDFNPSSHKQIIEVLNEAGWKPEDRTQTHIDTERELQQLRRIKKRTKELDIATQACYTKLQELRKTGWKVNEENLSTLPPSAPSPARALAKRILLEARRRTLTEWLGLVNPETNRIHGSFYGIGAWTHRMAHQRPNTANIPNEFDTNNKKKLYGKEMRALWQAPKNRLLVGVDAEGIQLRIFAHYVNSPELTNALVNGKKSDKTDPHSFNQQVLGEVCKSRQAAKRFLYALFLGAGLDKLAAILGCSRPEVEVALDRLIKQYPGFADLKENVIPKDAKRGWFEGLDGRSVRIPGEDLGTRRHLAMSGYLQNGEAVVMKLATLKWEPRLAEYNSLLVNFVHDEWQTETPNNMEIAIAVAKMKAQSLEEVGKELGLNCPLAGSYWNDDLNDYTIATNWSKTH